MVIAFTHRTAVCYYGTLTRKLLNKKHNFTGTKNITFVDGDIHQFGEKLPETMKNDFGHKR